VAVLINDIGVGAVLKQNPDRIGVAVSAPEKSASHTITSLPPHPDADPFARSRAADSVGMGQEADSSQNIILGAVDY
jgi:hypothetical protein